MRVTIRQAVLEDAQALQVLIVESVRKLQAAHYSPEQMEGARRYLFHCRGRLHSYRLRRMEPEKDSFRQRPRPPEG